MMISKHVQQIRSILNAKHNASRVRRIAQVGFNPQVYHIHVRKTGGTSLNMAVLGALTGSDGEQVYKSLAEQPDHRLIVHDKVVVGWNRSLINSGSYHFAFSHLPCHRLDLPVNTRTMTCLRDPVNRVISHYKMLMYFNHKQIEHPCMETEGRWIGKGFRYFLETIPRNVLLNQLYMFSEKGDPVEAKSRIEKCDFIFFTEQLETDIHHLEGYLGLPLQLNTQKRYDYHLELNEDELLMAREMLIPETKWILQIKEGLKLSQ